MPTPEPKHRWLRLSPDRFVVGVLLGVCLLWLSDRFQWFGFNHHKGWTVLIAVAAVGVAALVMLLWWIASLIFHWRFQFGIRSLLAFCLVCSIAAGWLAVERDKAQREQRMTEWVWSSGGGAYFDWQFDPDGEAVANPAPGAEWLRNLLGVNFFSEVVEITFTNSEMTDSGLEHVRSFMHLTSLVLGGSRITDAGLKCLRGLPQLKTLIADRTRVTDVGLQQLKDMNQLDDLSLDNTPVTDAGLANLIDLHRLQSLSLVYTKVTDAGLKHLEGLKQLQQLRLQGTGITDAGVKKLQQALPNCKIDH